jgi:hypothetical protein
LNSSSVGKGISARSSGPAMVRSEVLRRMKKLMRSVAGSRWRKARRNRSSQLGCPATRSTRSLSRVTRMRNARSLFSGTASSALLGMETRYTARPRRSAVTGRSIVASPCGPTSATTSRSTCSPRRSVTGTGPGGAPLRRTVTRTRAARRRKATGSASTRTMESSRKASSPTATACTRIPASVRGSRGTSGMAPSETTTTAPSSSPSSLDRSAARAPARSLRSSCGRSRSARRWSSVGSSASPKVKVDGGISPPSAAQRSRRA